MSGKGRSKEFWACSDEAMLEVRERRQHEGGGRAGKNCYLPPRHASELPDFHFHLSAGARQHQGLWTNVQGTSSTRTTGDGREPPRATSTRTTGGGRELAERTTIEGCAMKTARASTSEDKI